MNAGNILPLEQFQKDYEIISKISEGKFGQVAILKNCFCFVTAAATK
jgi:hypothetical protein